MTDRLARWDRYSSSGIVYSRTETNVDLQSFGVHWNSLYGDNSWNVFIKNLHFFSTEERNT